MKRINFEKAVPYFDNGTHKWYLDEHFNKYLKYQQADNLPPLDGFGVFVVKSDSEEDYVMIDSSQNILAAFKYTLDGFEQMEARINIMKISKSFDDYEKDDI